MQTCPSWFLVWIRTRIRDIAMGKEIMCLASGHVATTSIQPTCPCSGHGTREGRKQETDQKEVGSTEKQMLKKRLLEPNMLLHLLVAWSQLHVVLLLKKALLRTKTLSIQNQDLQKRCVLAIACSTTVKIILNTSGRSSFWFRSVDLRRGTWAATAS